MRRESRHALAINAFWCLTPPADTGTPLADTAGRGCAEPSPSDAGRPARIRTSRLLETLASTLSPGFRGADEEHERAAPDEQQPLRRHELGSSPSRRQRWESGAHAGAGRAARKRRGPRGASASVPDPGNGTFVCGVQRASQPGTLFAAHGGKGDELTAAKLLESFSGPEARTADLYERYGAQLHRYCRGHLRSPEDAEDAVQNTFLRVYAALRRGVVPEFEAAWLYKIAHNVCLSRRIGESRRSKVESSRDLQSLEEWVAAPESEHDELVGLADALASMPPNLRRAILLREWQGLSYSEIAEALGSSHSAVETLIFRARRHLARALDSSLKQPARRIAQALNLGPLVTAVREFLLRSAAAKLAAGAAVATGVAGGGFAVSYALEAQKPATRTVPGSATAPAAAAKAPGLTSGAGAAGAGPASAPRRSATPRSRAAAGGSSTSRVPVLHPASSLGTGSAAPAAASTSKPPAAGGQASEPGRVSAGLPGTGAVPTEAAAVPAATGDEPRVTPGQTTPPASTTASAGSAGLTQPAPTAPVPTARAAPAPTVEPALPAPSTAPTVTAAQVPVPTESLPPPPSVTAPTVPTVTAPTLPTVTAPTLPTATAPTLPTLTTSTLPTVTAPTLPTVTSSTLPTVTAPTLPTATAPTVTTTTVTVP